jgi:IS4 transposase
MLSLSKHERSLFQRAANPKKSDQLIATMRLVGEDRWAVFWPQLSTLDY